MDLDRLAEFAVIARSGSLKQASEELGIAPNVLSTRFSGFERSLGTKLIERNAHRFALTEQGETLLGRTRGLLEGYERLRSSMQSIRGSSFRALRLMLCAQTMPMELGPFLDRYCRAYPTLFLALYDENACRIREGLQSGEVDVVFAVGREGDFLDISGRIVLNTFPEMRVHVPNDHHLAKTWRIPFSALDGETFILYPRMKDPCTRDLQLSMLEQAGIDYRVYDEDSSPFFHDLLVPIGKGIRLWSWSERTAPNTTLLTIEDRGYETYLYLLYRKDSENPTVQHFIEQFLTFRKERG